MMDKHREIFMEEATELLAELEGSLLELESAPDDGETIGRIFRALHTIKGSGAMFGFDAIAAFTHELENAFDLVRNGKMTVTKPLIDLTLSAGDQIREMLNGADQETSINRDEIEHILRRLKELIPKEDSAQPEVSIRSEDTRELKLGNFLLYRIHFRPHPDIFQRGVNPVLLFNELRELGDCRIVAYTDSVPGLAAIDPEECHLYWDIFIATRHDKYTIRDVFIFVEGDCDLQIEVVDTVTDDSEEPPDKKLGEILIERGALTVDQLNQALREQKKLGEVLVDSGLVEPSKVQAALAEQQHIREIRKKQRKEGEASSIRVPAEKLDLLVDLVGELVTVQARLSQTVASQNYSDLSAIAEEVERLTSSLRENTMSIRMLPIGTIFSKFKRLVRDLAEELGKEIVMTTDGAETELDKTVIERLNDPLVHLIRNSIDHGIESAEAREAAGKPKHGTVHLSAVHAGANVLIHIKDDGVGFDPEQIRAKAIERGLISADARLSEKEIYALTLMPGFSTTDKITNISGRGVGMDVVKRSMDALRGSIEIDSRKGQGTTITLKLPLTLAIIDGLLVKVGEGSFVMPLLSVEECVELTREDIARARGQHLTYVRGELVPYIRLRDQFMMPGEPPEIEQIVVAEVADARVGFVVDKVIGEHQTVIKNLGKVYQDVEEISGATILGDGSVALMLDMYKLMKGVEERYLASQDA